MKLALAAVFIVVGSACSSSSGSDARPTEPEQSEPSNPARTPSSSNDGTPAKRPRAPVWNATSERFELTSFGYWQGSFGYAKAKAGLTPEQSKALFMIRSMPPPPNDERMSDAPTYQLRVIDKDGTSATYRAAEGNGVDSTEQNPGAFTSLDVETLKPLLETLHCLSPQNFTQVHRTTPTLTPPSADDLTHAPSLPTDVGCQNGVYLGDGCSDVALKLDVSAPTTYRAVANKCVQNMTLRLYASDATTLLAESTPSATPDACFTLEHDFDPGSYVIVISKTSAAGCNSHNNGDSTTLQLSVVKS